MQAFLLTIGNKPAPFASVALCRANRSANGCRLRGVTPNPRGIPIEWLSASASLGFSPGLRMILKQVPLTEPRTNFVFSPFARGAFYIPTGASPVLGYLSSFFWTPLRKASFDIPKNLGYLFPFWISPKKAKGVVFPSRPRKPPGVVFPRKPPGYAGPLCVVCAPHFRSAGSLCAPCAAETAALRPAALAAAGLLALGAAAGVAWRRRDSETTARPVAVQRRPFFLR